MKSCRVEFLHCICGYHRRKYADNPLYSASFHRTTADLSTRVLYTYACACLIVTRVDKWAMYEELQATCVPDADTTY